MAFGALLPCEECKGQFVFKSDAYYCSGDITAWTKCVAKTQTPNRKEWVIPKVGVHCIFDVLKHISELIEQAAASAGCQRAECATVLSSCDSGEVLSQPHPSRSRQLMHK